MSTVSAIDGMSGSEVERHALRLDRCPDCGTFPIRQGPRGGLSVNLICDHCGAKFNVAPPRFITIVERVR